MTITKRLLAVLLAVVFVAAACGSDGDESSDAPAAPTCDQEGTLNVPDDFDTIQEAADKAAPGALVLVAEGTYEEAVNVTCPDITIRGIDRNNVVLEGGFELENGIRILETDGVVVENMTAQNYTGNGFFWTGADGYRGSYLTAIRNGDYGVYAYGSVNGVFEHSYGSGSPDAGIYIGQCGDCNAVIDDFTSEWNGLGYSGTNSTNVTIVNSTFRHNRSGIVPNAGSYEGCAPPINNTIVDPEHWVLRILQETTSSGAATFLEAQNGVFANNLVYFDSSALATFANVGPNTQGGSFTFMNNLWYAHDAPGSSAPTGLPATESGAVVGQDPGLTADFHISAASPAAGAGTPQSGAHGDFDGSCWRSPPAIGALEAP